MKTMNIEMSQACTARVLEDVCKKANLSLASKYDRRRTLYSVEGSDFRSIKDAMAKAIFECELNGFWIETFGIKCRHGFPVFSRVA